MELFTLIPNKLINKKYLGPEMAPYNQWFSNNLDLLIDKNKDRIKCWFYGHTHTGSVQLIGKIPFLCNPFGYPGENSVRRKMDHYLNSI